MPRSSPVNENSYSKRFGSGAAMSLNWKEINIILEELDLAGAQIQGVTQNAYDVLILSIHKKGETKRVLVSLSPGACRIHETFRELPKSDKPLRFAQFLKSRLVNGWIEEAVQLGDNRIVHITVRRGENRYNMYIRLWSNAANCIVTDENNAVLDAMRRLPKKREISGGHYAPGETGGSPADSPAATKREYAVREFPPDESGGTDSRSFNRKVDDFYAAQGGSLSLETLREQARRACESSITRISAALEKLHTQKEKFSTAEKLREYGDIILANISAIQPGDAWLEAEYPYGAADSGGADESPRIEKIRIKIDPLKKPAAQAEYYYDQYRKAKNGYIAIQTEIAEAERELREIHDRLARILGETNPAVLARIGHEKAPLGKTIVQDKKRPGLCFRKNDWLIIVGRDAAENDALLRKHVKGNDLWLHVRDYAGSYVFIKQRSGKTVPLEILLDAGNLAVFYSKGRNSGEGDLYYTPVKYLRRAKNGPKGLVIPTQEKNLHITLDENRLKELEKCRILKT